MTINELAQLIKRLRYHDFRFEIKQDREFAYLQVEFTAFDSDTETFQVQRGRKWKLSPHMTKSEIVQTAFKAVMTTVEHEVRETFFYNDAPIFGPHFDVDALAEIVGKRDKRRDPISANV